MIASRQFAELLAARVRPDWYSPQKRPDQGPPKNVASDGASAPSAELSSEVQALLSADEYRPLPFYLRPGDGARLRTFSRELSVTVCDTIDAQLREWVACSAEDVREVADDAAVNERVSAELAAATGTVESSHSDAYGTWFYYPWRRTVVHLLPRAGFALVRSNRNRDKIDRDEQQRLSGARIGVIGLSVGHAAAMVLAQEGLCGGLRIADFDTLELSNLNRLRTTVFNLGVAKSTIAARDLAEIDPYLPVDVFAGGITTDNVDTFLSGEDGRAHLDLVVEECDSLAIKLLVRERARAFGIPVVMDTNDRGLLDVERFDLEPERAVLHGLLGDLDYERAKDLDGAARLELFCAFFGGRERMSERFRESLDRLGRELLGASQLSSDVHLGAALVANAARRILLGQLRASGRHTIDLDRLIIDR